MITTAACFALVLSAPIALVALLAERGALMLRWPVRWTWTIAMAAMVLLPVAMLGLRARAHIAPPTTIAELPPASARVATSRAPALSERATPRVISRDMRSLADRWGQALVALERATRAADGVLLAAWALLSGGLALLAWRARMRLHALPRTLATHDVQGLTVHVSESIGPAAIGGKTPAIVLPAWVLELDRTLLDLVLRHEQEHLRARDPRLLLAGLGWLVLMPWHAPLWWAWHRLRLAIELDCDARVLRASGSPRVYAQLLLFMSQQRAMPRASSRSSSLRQMLDRPFALPFSIPLLLTFNPHLHHLTRRIDAMTARPVKHPARVLAIVAGMAVMTTLATAIPAPSIASSPSGLLPASERLPATAGAADSVIVKVHRLGLHLDAPSAAGAPLEIVIYGDGPVPIGLGKAVPTLLADTIRLDHLPAFTADVTNGDVHIELRRAAGTLELGGDVLGGAMTTFDIRARHVVLSKRATGVRVGKPSPVEGARSPGAAATSSARPVRSGAAASRESREALRLADSVGARKATAELQRVRLLANYSPTFPQITELDREIGALDAVLERLPSAAASRAMGQVIDALQARRDGLGLELDRLQLKYSANAPSVVAARDEYAQLGKRLPALEKSRAR